MKTEQPNYLILDTNILLLSADNILNLSNDETTIVIPHTVLAELDAKKSGFEEINYQARNCARLIDGAEIVKVQNLDEAVITTVLISGTEVEITTLTEYKSDPFAYGGNDARIIEVADYYGFKSGGRATLMTNDVLMKFQAVAEGTPVTSLRVVDESDPEFVKEMEIKDPEVFRTLHDSRILDVDIDTKTENYSYKFTCSNTNRMKLASVIRGVIKVLGKDTETLLRQQKCAPINSEQLLASRAIQDPLIDLVLIEGQAGCGKNIVALSNAVRLVQTNRDKYSSIAYIRAPINDESLGEDIGYLAGNEEKLAMYLGPMEDSLDFIVRSEINTKGKKKIEVDEIVAKNTEKLVDECGIESMISTGLRGKTFHDTVLIIDEAQNGSAATTQKILTRVGKNCKVIVIGSQRQIDSKYVNKYNNGLSILTDEARDRRTNTDINMFAITLHKVVRSEMAMFSEELFSK